MELQIIEKLCAKHKDDGAAGMERRRGDGGGGMVVEIR